MTRELTAREAKIMEIRRIRNRLLRDSDWTQLPDAPIDTTKRSEWGTYRQSLRDLPSQPDLNNISWPATPN